MLDDQNSAQKSVSPIWERQQRLINGCTHLNYDVNCKYCSNYLECTSCIFPACDECEYLSNCWYLKIKYRKQDPMDYCLDHEQNSCLNCRYHGFCPAIRLVNEIPKEVKSL